MMFFQRNQSLSIILIPGSVEQSVASPTADPGIVSSNWAQSHTFVEINHCYLPGVTRKEFRKPKFAIWKVSKKQF